MQLPRRDFLCLAASTAALPVLPRIAQAKGYPSRPVHLIVGFAAGSASDIAARLIGQSLSDRLGQPFVIENHAGAGGKLGDEMVMHASADGYTLLLWGNNDAINATLYDNFDDIHGIAPVASIARGPLVLVVHPSFPAKTVPEFIAYAKANPGKINFGSAGIGSVVQLAAELFKGMAGVNMVHVPYRGMAPALTDLIGGRVQVIFSTLPPAIGHVRAGRLRALAVTSKARSDALPGLPTVAEFLPGYEADIVLGLGAPRNTPADIIGKLNKATNAALADSEIKARLGKLGIVPLPMTSADFGKLRVAETEKWRKVIRMANLKLK
ncbi:MAG TPA: tripartite tricarboxylate transporter substrate binding protein [Pseudolabrys sp.]|nr:tripartite tricarboxylate transporter substrate binding protein [Pseudolabrys sp.]